MSNEITPITTHDVESKIISIRRQHVILDCDVSELYGVETRILNQAVKNFDRKLISNKSRYLPKAFTERGLYLLATILKSRLATQTTLAIIDTFVEIREKA